jgi:hypothetical protein
MKRSKMMKVMRVTISLFFCIFIRKKKNENMEYYYSQSRNCFSPLSFLRLYRHHRVDVKIEQRIQFRRQLLFTKFLQFAL